MAEPCLGGDIISCKYSLQALLQKHLTVVLGEGVTEIKRIIWCGSSKKVKNDDVEEAEINYWGS